MKSVTAKSLRESLKDIPDSCPVIVSGEDHGYATLIAIKKTPVLVDRKGVLTEDYGETLTPSSTYGRRQEAVELVFHQSKG